MTTATLDAPAGPLTLVRPGTGDASLRAWDAADELLLQEAFARLNPSRQPRVLVIDDQFGALTLGLNPFQPDLVADSATLPAALADNAGLNSGLASVPEVRSWRTPPDARYDAVVLRIPRHADYLAWLLRWVNGVLAEDGLLLAGGMIKHLPDRGVDVFAQAVTTDTVCPARKKARVIVCRPGTAELAPGARVLDLACGNGVVGMVALSARPDLALTFSDVSSQAIVSAERNVEAAFADSDCSFDHADGVGAGAGRFDLILLNPPFHEGGVVGDHIALRLFAQASRHLAPGGGLLMVGNRHLGYHRSLRRFFPQVRQLDANPKFVVLEAATKR